MPRLKWNRIKREEKGNPDYKKLLKKAEGQVKHWQKKAHVKGETHSRKGKKK
jgi:hypothetical protein